MLEIQVLDTHTGGEPTRVVIQGGPELGGGSLVEQRERFRQRHDGYRSAIVNEPRGSDVVVGALLCPPSTPGCVAGVIFFNNIGYLHMCGHGTIGVAVALGHLGRIQAGRHALDTPVGVVHFDHDGGNVVSLDNVPSYRHATGVRVEVEGKGAFTGDVAWGGNWFFLVRDQDERIPPLRVENTEALTDLTWRIRQSLVRHNVTGANGGEIDHIEVFGPPADRDNHSRNFVLCPGKAYDRSPCGTGTSAKLACLQADGKLRPGEVWRQESIIGSVFEGSYQLDGDRVIPRIKGTAHVMAESTLILDPGDPLCWGIRS